MRNIEMFYKELKTSIPKIDSFNFWKDYDWSEDGYENSSIMTDLAREIVKWNLKTEHHDFSKLFQIIEVGFIDYDKATSSFLATDFLVTIMEVKDKYVRDEIKKFMRSETQEKYKAMLQFYREA